MSWMRFNGEKEFSDILLYAEKQQQRFVGDFFPVLVELHPFACEACRYFLFNLLTSLDRNSDIRVQIIIAEGNPNAELIMGRKEVVCVPQSILSANQLHSMLGADSGETSVFLFDTYGHLWFAHRGKELEDELTEQILRWLNFLAIQCPE